VGSLTVNEQAEAVGRNEAGDWLYIRRDDETEAWVFINVLTLEDDVSILPIMDETVAPPPIYGPMQSFLFRSGFNDALCDQAPDSGILIQTPEGVGEIELNINAVEIILGSTIYIQAQPGQEMIIHVVEGQAQVAASGLSVTVPAGARVRVPLDDTGRASGPPAVPEPYEAAALAALPVSHLERAVVVAEGLTMDELGASGDSVADNSLIPRPGMWHWTWEAGEYPCTGNDRTVAFREGLGYDRELTVLDDGRTLRFDGSTLQQVTPGSYDSGVTGSRDHRFEVISPERMEGEITIYYAGDSAPCGRATVPGVAELIGPA
jgi:hypothetical protein